MDDNWMVAQTYIDGHPVVIRSRAQIVDAETRKTNPVLVLIRWDYSDESGDMPPVDVEDAQEEFAHAIEQSISEDPWCVEAATLTGNGQKEWRFYSASAEQFQQGLNDALMAHPVYPLDFEVFDDPDWDGLAEIVNSAKPN